MTTRIILAPDREGLQKGFTLPTIMEKIKIEGIKLSNELFQVNLRNRSNQENTISQFCQILAAHQINIPFFSTTYLDQRIQVSCCVAVEDKHRVRNLIDSEPELGGDVKFMPSVGLLSVFPHQSSLKILGLSLYAIGKARLPLYGLASSLSALTFITDYIHLDKAAATLEQYLELPSNQRPFRSEIGVRQSSIVKK
ncbi:MAG: hypothetical protein PVH99_08340 [Desulfobacteraceae bacterium]|jgi:aspartokinase